MLLDRHVIQRQNTCFCEKPRTLLVLVIVPCPRRHAKLRDPPNLVCLQKSIIVNFVAGGSIARVI